jgi:hypothetical protein
MFAAKFSGWHDRYVLVIAGNPEIIVLIIRSSIFYFRLVPLGSFF